MYVVRKYSIMIDGQFLLWCFAVPVLYTGGGWNIWMFWNMYMCVCACMDCRVVVCGIMCLIQHLKVCLYAET